MIDVIEYTNTSKFICYMSGVAREIKKIEFQGSLKKRQPIWSNRLASYSRHINIYMSEELSYIDNVIKTSRGKILHKDLKNEKCKIFIHLLHLCEN